MVEPGVASARRSAAGSVLPGGTGRNRAAQRSSLVQRRAGIRKQLSWRVLISANAVWLGVVAENPSERDSSRLPHIAMVEAADFGQFDDAAQLGSLCGPRLGGVAIQR
jgi:hypothetical protein